MRFQITPEGEITKYIKEMGDPVDLIIPAVIDGVSVTSIGKGAFSGCLALKSAVIPKGVRSIENGAFFDCIALESVMFPESLESIGDYAFYDCATLKFIKIPEGLRSIGERAFFECSALRKIFVANPAEVARVRGLLPENLQALVQVNRWSERRSAWIGSVIFAGCLDPRRDPTPADAGAPAGGAGAGAV